MEIKSVLSDKEKDVELIFNSDSLPSQKVEAMIGHMSSLLAFPFTVAKVLHITQDPKSGASHLASAITADPTMIAHILKVANSVFFAGSHHRINSIKDAIVRIGFLETKKIAMSMWVMDLFDKKNKSSGFDESRGITNQEFKTTGIILRLVFQLFSNVLIKYIWVVSSCLKRAVGYFV